ncbi:MAG TPA: type I pantothenate kinase, partial [Actinomycetes bacterium]|nr:type I pantothenate kinase [Actinomycetes bacterium]
ADPASYFRRYADLSDDDARATATAIWREVNGPNLAQNILPTRGRATLVLEKGPDHAVRQIRLRKL